MLTVEPAAAQGEQSVHVLVLCIVHRLRVFLYSQPIHWCHHRAVQCTEEEGEHSSFTYFILLCNVHAGPGIIRLVKNSTKCSL